MSENKIRAERQVIIKVEELEWNLSQGRNYYNVTVWKKYKHSPTVLRFNIRQTLKMLDVLLPKQQLKSYLGEEK